jgi:hypothetical protein
MTECTATQYIEAGWRVTSTAQMQLLMRAQDYTTACLCWSQNISCKPYSQYMDHLRSSDLARMAATLAFLAFPDLRPEKVAAEVAA